MWPLGTGSPVPRVSTLRAWLVGEPGERMTIECEENGSYARSNGVWATKEDI